MWVRIVCAFNYEDRAPLANIPFRPLTHEVIAKVSPANPFSYGLNPIFETRQKDALCIEWRHNGQDGKAAKVASAHTGVQAAGCGKDENG